MSRTMKDTKSVMLKKSRVKSATIARSESNYTHVKQNMIKARNHVWVEGNM